MGAVAEPVAGDGDEVLVQVQALHLVPAGELLEVFPVPGDVEEGGRSRRALLDQLWMRSASAT